MAPLADDTDCSLMSCPPLSCPDGFPDGCSGELSPLGDFSGESLSCGVSGVASDIWL